MALDRRGDRLGQVPAAGEDAADQRVVDAELAALVVQALLGRAGRAVDLLRVARVGVHEHELADVVQQRGDEQAVAVLVAGLGGEAVGGALDGDGVQAEALGGGVPRLAALEELEGLGVGGELLHGLGREHLDGADDGVDLAAARGRRTRWRAAGRRSPARRRTRSRATTSPTEGRSSATSASRRLRDSASAGKTSSASKAAVRRLPWPSLRERPTAA